MEEKVVLHLKQLEIRFINQLRCLSTTSFAIKGAQKKETISQSEYSLWISANVNGDSYISMGAHSATWSRKSIYELQPFPPW